MTEPPIGRGARDGGDSPPGAEKQGRQQWRQRAAAVWWRGGDRRRWLPLARSNGKETVMTRSILSAALVALVCLGAAPAQEEGKPRTHTFSGELTKMAKDSLTVTSRSDKGAVAQTFTTGPKTKVLVETDKDVDVTGADGKVLKRPARQEVKLSELKLGERVVVTHTEDKKATQVVQPRPPVKPPVKKPPKEGGR